jgi:serine/threonine-protein kinase
MSTRTLSMFDLAPGKSLLDRYKILRANRHGGMATTFEVERAKDGELLELQIFPSSLFENADQGNDFGRELARWKAVHDDSVLAVRDVHTLEDGTVLFVTDFPPGHSLRDHLKAHARIPPAQILAIAAQLLDELSAIHAAGLVHGDIKPHTIHVEVPEPKNDGPKADGSKAGGPKPEGKTGLHVTLVDGGITPALWAAKHLGDKTQLIGTPFYAPVEQFGGEAPDVQSDVYNLATVLYEAVSGVLPWKGQSFLGVFQAKLAPTPPPMRDLAPKVQVPHDLEVAIAGGLFASKDKRYPSAAAFRAKLDAVKL